MGSPSQTPSAGRDLVIRSMEGDVLSPEGMLREAAEAFRQEGAAGSQALAGLLRELTHSRSRHAHHAVFLAQSIEPTPELIIALREVLAAPPLRQGGSGSFPPEILGEGRVGWSDATYRRLQEFARDALAKLQPTALEASTSASSGVKTRISSLFAQHFDSLPVSPDSGLSLRPDVSQPALRRACATFAPFDEGERVLAFIDNTIRAADEGVVVTDRRVFFTAAPPAPKRQCRDFQELGYSVVVDGLALRLEDMTEIVLATDPAIIERLARFLNDARDAAVAEASDRVGPIAAALLAEETVHYARCWFCEKEPPADGLELTAELRREARQRDRGDNNAIELRTDTASIKVPRCRTCAANHTRREKIETWLLGAAFLLFASLWAALAIVGYPKAGFLAGAFLGIGLGGYLIRAVSKNRWFLPDGVKAQLEKLDFPPVKRLESEGWTETESGEAADRELMRDFEGNTKPK